MFVHKPYTLQFGARLMVALLPVGGADVGYLGGQGDLISRLIMGIIGVTTWVIGVTNLLTKSP